MTWGIVSILIRSDSKDYSFLKPVYVVRVGTSQDLDNEKLKQSQEAKMNLKGKHKHEFLNR